MDVPRRVRHGQRRDDVAGIRRPTRARVRERGGAGVPRVAERPASCRHGGADHVQPGVGRGVPAGVVPRESPASWGSLAGGRGMEALKAQAVAARSYALSGSRPSGATTCDTTACQVYRGAAFQPFGQPRESLEAANTDTAIAATSGEVRVRANGAVVRTEFSSSTGGWTAGGEFPAVVDEGDDTSRNPNHRWVTTQAGSAATFSAADVAARLGVQGIRSMTVTGRNGLGAGGGRVTEVTVVDGAGRSRTYTGNQVRVALNLRSDWFSISAFVRAEAEAVVKALYQDLLGRGPTPPGSRPGATGSWPGSARTSSSAR
ncbi:SpoIID/LytB domain-containing protein [Cellulomonas sp. ATA003]|uniref:SpoIID/LytB domain-containing protein n=1 Tax=Cellulomonas sp. ATA003 TaxID=3073064 RepID=UPI0028738BBF|nr:SpoIID/LytB domain-containing protein [Cellulomonas sp. ATA003]WNB86313.1 SpoIID/LytB domain-containing protein [Cellulomonas sp. ATA003]